jgi:hypothetical protein
LFFAIHVTSCGEGANFNILEQKNVPDNVQLTAPEEAPLHFYFDENFFDVMEFEQGVMAKYPIADAAHVPAPGTPIVEVENLPEGATFDGRMLSWLPPCGEFSDFYLRGYGVHYILVTLRSSAHPDDYLKRRAALLAHKFKDYDDLRCEDL